MSDCQHDWRQNYYGTECIKCGLFYSEGNAPWDEPCDINYTSHNDILKGLARKCPKCNIIDHYDVNGREPTEVTCKCGHHFIVQKYKRGERPRGMEVGVCK